MNFLAAIWIVIGLAVLVVTSIYGGPVVALLLVVALAVVYFVVRRSRPSRHRA